MKKYRWLLFDADNTLLDFTRAEKAGLTDTFADVGLCAEDSVIAKYSEINDGLWKDLEKGLVTKDRLKVLRFERLCDFYSLKADPVRMAEAYVKNLSKYSFLCEGAEELCRALFGKYDMYIITNGIKSIQTSRFGGSRIKDYFSHSFISEEVGCEKPGRAFFDHVASFIDGFDPELALVIGDSLSSDIRGGADYGIDTCWYNPKGAENKSGLDITYTVSDHAELAELLGVSISYKKIKTAISELRAQGISFDTDSPLSARTSFKIGGKADIAIFPESEEQLISSVEILKKADLRFMVAGNGTNLLFSDKGYRGAVIFTRKMRNIKVDGNVISVLCGDSFTEAAVAARDAALTGLEFAYGIPGSCGGAVCMNAGAYGSDVSAVLKDARVLDIESGAVNVLPKDALDLSYRHSTVKDDPNLVVLSARFELEKGDKAQIGAVMQDLMGRRREKQPVEFPSAGSVFKRPAPDKYVGKMVEESGLKGYTIGGAQVSEKHAGFIINIGNATANDVVSLVEHIKKTVLQNYSVDLECEICMVSEE